MARSLGIDTTTQTNHNSLVIKGKAYKPITVKASQSAVMPVGQVLARDKASGHYQALAAEQTVTNTALTNVPTNPDGLFHCAATTASVPIIPGSFSGTFSNTSPVTFTDTGKGQLSESTGIGRGLIDYESGQIEIFTNAAMVTTSALTASFKHMGPAGLNLDLNDIAILVPKTGETSETIDASTAYATNALVEGEVDAALLTPSQASATVNTYNMFKNAGLRLNIKTALI